MIKIQKFTFNDFQLNTYILYTENGECIIVDPGCHNPDECRELDDFISENKLKPERLINTHCHVDHILGNAYVTEKYGLGLEAHEKEQDNLRQSDPHAFLYGLGAPKSPPISRFLNDGDEITLGSNTLQVLLVPGHTAGHIVLYCKNNRFVISGDVLFERSIGRTDLPGGNYEQLIDSIFTKLFILEDDVVVYPGHGAPTTIGEEKKYNPFLADYL